MSKREGRWRAALLAGVAALGLGGCAAGPSEREARLEGLEQAVQELRAKQARLEEENAALNAQLAARASAPALANVSPPSQDAPEIRQEIARLTESVARSGGARPPVPEHDRSAPAGRPGMTAARPPVREAEPARAEEPSDAADKPAPKTKGAALYDEALRAHLAGKTAPARDMFTSFIEANPENALTPNALYWLGETWYSEKDYAQAILRFQETVSRFPGHHKAADSLLKIGLSYERLGDKANAALYYRALLDDYPAARVAAQARARLKALE